MKKVLLVFVAFLLIVWGWDKYENHVKKTWSVKYRPNNIDYAMANRGNCRVYVQWDGNIRLNAYDPTFNLSPKRYKDGTYHNLTLNSHGVATDQFWTPSKVTDGGEFGDDQGPDLFWKSCGAELTTLPPTMLRAFNGWHGLPLQK